MSFMFGRSALGGMSKKSWRLRERLYPVALSTPATIFMLLFFLYPLVFSLKLSVRDVQLYNLSVGGTSVGFSNYLRACRDPMLWNALVRTGTFVACSVSIEVVLGVLIALLLNLRFKGRQVVRALALAPLTLTPVVLAINFKMMFNYLYGIINYLLGTVGIEPVMWLADPVWSMVSIVFTEVWNQTPFVVLVALAGIQSIPGELFESASMDGANAFQVFWNITLPQIKPMLGVAIFWRTIATFRVYDIIFVLTGGGPSDATESMSMLISRIGFGYGQMGYAFAMSYLMIALMIIMATVYSSYLQ